MLVPHAGTQVSLTVLHLPSKQNHSQPTDFVIDHAYGQSFTIRCTIGNNSIHFLNCSFILHQSVVHFYHYPLLLVLPHPPHTCSLPCSGDGKYVAAGQADTVVVWQRDDTKPTLTYTLLFSYTTPLNTFFVESNSISIAANAPVLAVGWINIQAPAGQNRLTVFRLPSKTPLIDHKGPIGQGQYQNIVTGVRVSESGKYVAVTSWGNQVMADGTQQLEVITFKLDFL